MSLPYGPVVRGFTPSWIYEHVRDALVANLKNVYGVKHFEGREAYFIGYEELPPEVAESPNLPTARISLSPGIQIGNSLRAGIPEIFFSGGTVVHTGTGAEPSLSGTHAGNNRFVLEITASGVVGTDGSYELRRSIWDGSTWSAEEVVSSGMIPADGKIACGNGQTLNFTAGQDVIQGDTYSWETEAYRVSNVLGRTAVARARIDVVFWNVKEITWAPNNPLDQFMCLFNKRNWKVEAFTGRYVEVEEELTRILPHKEQISTGSGEDVSTRQVFIVALELAWGGTDGGKEPIVFTALVSPFVTAKVDEAEIHEQEIPS